MHYVTKVEEPEDCRLQNEGTERYIFRRDGSTKLRNQVIVDETKRRRLREKKVQEQKCSEGEKGQRHPKDSSTFLSKGTKKKVSLPETG